MINDTLNQLVANAKSIMYENTLLFRCEEAEIVARINQEWFKPFAASETMYMMVLSYRSYKGLLWKFHRGCFRFIFVVETILTICKVDTLPLVSISSQLICNYISKSFPSTWTKAGAV